MTKAEIEKLKAKHGQNLKEVTVITQDGETFVLIIKKPTRNLIQVITSLKGDDAKGSEVLIENCVVGGDIDSLEDADVYVIVLEEISKYLGGATIEVKKL